VNKSLKIEYRFWISCNDQPILGKGKMNLLLKIVETGSLKKAAEELKISYRKAYYSVAKMNEVGNEPVVILKRGGKRGGTSEVTNYGLELISIYSKLEQEFSEFISSKDF
jgi:molybdate transport system regulatory protein